MDRPAPQSNTRRFPAMLPSSRVMVASSKIMCSLYYLALSVQDDFRDPVKLLAVGVVNAKNHESRIKVLRHISTGTWHRVHAVEVAHPAQVGSQARLRKSVRHGSPAIFVQCAARGQQFRQEGRILAAQRCHAPHLPKSGISSQAPSSPARQSVNRPGSSEKTNF